MRLEIDQADFQTLSAATQRELIQNFAGKIFTSREGPRGRKAIKWREPVDITEDQAKRLIHGLSEDHRRRLSLFARKNGRVRMKEILTLTEETDLRATTAFQSEMTRRLRRLIDDPDKRAQLIGWDFDATKWDDNRTTITDGVYYVSAKTAEALKACFKAKAA